MRLAHGAAVLALTLAWYAPSAAHAQQNRGSLENANWYFAIDNWSYDDTDITAYGLGLGYDFNNFLSAEVDYYRTEKIIGVYEWGTKGFLRGNLRVDPFVFFLRAGVGYEKLAGLPSGADDSSVLGVWGLGLEFYLSKNLAITASRNGDFYDKDWEDALDFTLYTTSSLSDLGRGATHRRVN